MTAKRPAEDNAQQGNKLPKIEENIISPLSQSQRAPTDFSSSVKKKLNASTRTGQACDRCKIRKIRCDGKIGGCSPCLQNNTACKTTDRITGRATTRGHTEALEAENAFLRQQVTELQTQLKENGIEPKQSAGYNGYAPAGYQPQGLQWTPLGAEPHGQPWRPEQSPGVANAPPLPVYGNSVGASLPPLALDSNVLGALPAFKVGSIGDNYLGVSSADSLLSPIKGTSLSVFGTEIDLTDFIQGDADYRDSIMSYEHFLSVALNRDQDIEVVPYPPFQKLAEFANWYLRSLNPYTAILDKPTFMNLIWRIWHDDKFAPSSAEIVMVHMMLAILKYQISVRNRNDTMLEESHKHYRYSLSFFQDLLASHTLQDVQALALICIHLRNFPKPGAAWIMSWTTFAVAIELGLHRSAKVWAETAPKRDLHEVEMRKRVFWTLYALNVGLSGKLGRPMPIRMEDVDVEFPEPVDDYIPHQEDTLSKFHKCSIQVGIQTAKVIVLFGEMYSTVYAVRQPPNTYEETVRRLEAGIRSWRDQLPPELSPGFRANQESYIFALYLQFWDQEFQLLLHHPAICRSTNPVVMKSNLDICLKASTEMLHNVNELRKFKSLDIPWINCTVYIAAIFTTLFVHSQRKENMTTADMNKLRHDMNLWLDVMGECGELLGTGSKLKNAIEKIVEHSLHTIGEHLAKKAASEVSVAVARAALSHTSQQEANAGSNGYGNASNYAQYSEPTASSNDLDAKPNYLSPDDPSMSNPTNPYPAVPAPQYSYSNGTSTSIAPYQSNTNAFDQPTYPSVGDPGMSAAHAAAIASAASAATPQTAGDSFIYSNSNATSTTPSHYAPHGASNNDLDAWRQWSRVNVMNPLGPPEGYHRPQEYLNTANTLMALGGRDSGTQAPGQDGSGGVEDNTMQTPGSSATSWPLMLFGIGLNGSHVGGPQ
ncbi:hypothetical protein K432DRAFT_347212 [Lepidopterella palustris CBS 459.81]|uniref:Zn(2)-C6 fungal-type domain-containing protein n=1 Tax=Lepidopterella palustris CBS 459.81 TaxID=1314670 RepID=A0A8E2EG73_9PEZI|nr:hypothetical protein K432DRAFT_347212 [Lepidopterella palustris CBS 459.81]